MSVKRTQRERREATRGALIGAGRALFGTLGYAETSTNRIVEEAGVTRGALYHHFEDKADLFRAVYESVEQEVVEQIAAAVSSSDDVRSRLRAGAAAFLEACIAQDVQRIALVDAPAVLGWEQWKRIQADHGLGLLTAELDNATEAGALRPQPTGALARVLFGALTEGALHIARSPRPGTARGEVAEVIDNLVESMLTAPG